MEIVKEGSPRPKAKDNADGTLKAPFVSRDRAAAEWVLGLQADHAEVQFYQDRRIFKLKHGDPLPDGDFHLSTVDIRNAPVTSADLDRLADLPGLESVVLIQTAIDGSAVPKLARIPLLSNVNVTNTAIRTSELGMLRDLPCFSMLWLSTDQINDDFEFAGQLKHLRRLSLWGSTLPPLAGLADCSHLRMLALHVPRELLDETIVAELQAQNPRLSIRINNEPVGADRSGEAARKLQSKGVEVGADLRHAGERDPEGSGWIEIPAGVELTPEERDSLNLFAGQLGTFKGEELHDADEYASVLCENEWLRNLKLSGSDLTDAGLSQLAKIVVLRWLSVVGTQVTQAGVEEFKRQVPRCYVASDFGEYEREYRLPPAFAAADPWTPDYTRDRAAAEWVLGVGGTVQLHMPGKLWNDINDVAELPNEPFRLRRRQPARPEGNPR